MVRHPLIGMGYESFWLGPRLERVELLIDQMINQAHNGYIEIYLNLGWIGIALLVIVLLTAYRRVITGLSLKLPLAGLWLGYFIVAVAYNFTEAGFKMTHPVWISFLSVAMVNPYVLRTDNLAPMTADESTQKPPKVLKRFVRQPNLESWQRRRRLWAHCI